MRHTNLCGIAGWHPEWLQKFANVKVFLIIYGLLGTTQWMAFIYFNATLTTLEKRFNIPSGTAGKPNNFLLKRTCINTNEMQCKYRYPLDWKRNISDIAITDPFLREWPTKSSQVDFMGNDNLFDILLHIGTTSFYLRSR